MKYLFLLFCFFCFGYGFTQNQTAEQLKKKMALIRQTTKWDDADAAKKANDEIKNLSKQLMMINNPSPQPGQAGGQQTPKTGMINEEDADYRQKLMDKMMKGVQKGNNADILLAEPLREKIKEDYKEDESPKNIRHEYLDAMTVLVIDMSLPTVQRTIDQMGKYNSVKTLVITGGKIGAPVNLPDLISRASHFPLISLYIINFRNFVTTIPTQINQFKDLSTLALFNNKISHLPEMSQISSSIDSLYVDANPVSTLFPAIGSMSKLKKLGLVKTSVSEPEINKIKQLLPKCQIITK